MSPASRRKRNSAPSADPNAKPLAPAGQRATPAASAAETLDAGLAELARQGLVLPSDARDKLLEYVTLLDKWNQTYNLTAIREPERMVTQHLLDSLAIIPALDLPQGARVLDLGSGAGLPGIPLAVARPDLAVTVLDANSKKTAFLAQARMELGLANLTVLQQRVTGGGEQSRFNVVISRAFAELADFLRLARPFLTEGGLVVAMKGGVPHEEIAALGEQATAKTVQISVPGLPARRCLVILQVAK